MVCFFLPLFLLFFALCAEDYSVNLTNPTFSEGCLRTDQGGIISSPSLRLQAQHIEYVNRIENGVLVKQILAEGDLLFEYHHQIFVAKKLSYDLVTKTGTLVRGRTTTDYWFFGGEKIELFSDGSFIIEDAYLTTVESDPPWWQFSFAKVDVSRQLILSAKNIKVSFFHCPVFWFPSFKINLRSLKEPAIRYKFFWDHILKQKITLRYALYTSEKFNLYGRLDYRLKKGPGAAFETDYLSTDQLVHFQTRSYGAFDKIVPDESGNKRFRLQGLCNIRSRDDTTQFYMSYDRMRDDKMVQDFTSEDFEINTQERSILFLNHFKENYISRFTLQPRINPFQSINQQLPLIVVKVKPFSLGSSKIISDNSCSIGYLDYVFAKRLAKELKSMHSLRGEVDSSLYRHFSLKNLLFTPSIGGSVIFYSQTPQHRSLGEFLGSYGAELSLPLYRHFSSLHHLVKPYIRYEGLAIAGLKNHYIFGIQDGYAKKNAVRLGTYNGFYPRLSPLLPTATFDLYAYLFFGTTAFDRVLPKIYFDSEFRYPSCYVQVMLIYNLQELLWDRTNVKLDWTLSEDVALGIEFRHRSRFDWRKSEDDNFFLEIVRPINFLLSSPISDGRNTLLARFQIRFTPLWSCHIESHLGWGRKDEPRYDAYDIKLSTLLTGKWQLQFSYRYSPALREWVFPLVKLISTEF